MKPIIFYIDDEPHNLTVFEASLPSDWEIKTFSNPFQALEALETCAPWIIVTDQRMPGISGVKYLELARKIHPHAVRIIATGYSEEDLVVESVRKAQVFDYIKKPWEPEDLETSLRRAIDYYQVQSELRSREKQLETQNAQLKEIAEKLKAANSREKALREELECWVPPFLIYQLKENDLKLPLQKDIVGLTFDIINSSQLHDLEINGTSLRTQVIRLFSEAVIKHGGWRESHSGDSAYGHFGLWDAVVNPFESALAATREFRVAIHNLCEVYGVNFDCGIALHVAKETTLHVHTVQISTPQGIITQKSFDTSSQEVDLLHRIEKVVHSLPGTNLIMSGPFVRALKKPPANVTALGLLELRGQKTATELFLIPSEKVTPQDIAELKKNLGIAEPVSETSAEDGVELLSPLKAA